MKTLPLVSIGFPTFNNGTYIDKALESLSKQTYKNVEIIISNNSSTDETELICKRFVHSDNRIHYFVQKKNIGAISNFNFVFSKARGKYFMWAAGDDHFNQNYVNDIVNELEKLPNAAIGVSNLIYFRHNQKEFYKLKFDKFQSSFISLKTFLLHPKYISTVFYGIYRVSSLKKIFKRSKLLTNPFHFSYTDDTRFLFRFLLSNALVHIDKYYFFKRDGTYKSKMKTDLIQKDISQSTVKIIFQNLLLLISNLCNFFYFQFYIYKSNHLFFHKLLLTIYCFFSIIINSIDFAKNTITCIYWVILGFLKPLFIKKSYTKQTP